MEFKKITFPNGLRLLLIPRPRSLAATVLILVEAGSEYETKRVNGVSHFLEHMTFRGTANRSNPGQINDELDALGAQSNAFTSHEYTGYWAKAEHHKLTKVLEIVSDLYLNPLFNPREIEKERSVIIEEIKLDEDTPTRKIHDTFSELLYGNQPAGWDIAGEKEIIMRLKREDLAAYHDKRYRALSTAVVVAGKFSEAEVMRQVRHTFGQLRRRKGSLKPKTKEKQLRPECLVKFKALDQSHFILGVRAFDLFDKRRYAIQILADLLGGGRSSRLFKRVREEMGVAYYVYARPDLYLDRGYFLAAAGVDHERIQHAITAILEEFVRMKKELVPESELQKSKNSLIGNLILELETPDQLASFYGSQEILTKKILPPGKIISKIKVVSAEEVRSVARAIFRDKKLNLAVIGPHKRDANFKKILKL